MRVRWEGAVGRLGPWPRDGKVVLEVPCGLLDQGTTSSYSLELREQMFYFRKRHEERFDIWHALYLKSLGPRNNCGFWDPY